MVVVVDPPLLRVAVEGSDNPRRSSMLLEVYKCVQLNRCAVVCGCVLQRRLDRCG